MATNRRARELERERLRRQASRRTQKARRQRRIALVAGAAVVVLLAVLVPVLTVGGGSAKASAVTCDYVVDAATRTATSPGLPPDPKATGAHTATLVLTQGSLTGTVRIALNAKAPCTVNSFAFLAGKKFFDGTTCHRETADPSLSVLQCGDPTGTGTGGPGYTIPDEDLTGATYRAGTVAMANTGSAHTGGSQFFLVYKDSTLPPSYTPVGTVTAGLDVLQKIAQVGITGGATDGAPATPVTIATFRVS